MNHLYEQFASNISRTRINGSFRVLCKPRLIFSRINGPIVGMLLFFQLICMTCGREGHGAECMVRAQKLHSEQRSFLLPWLHSRIPGADGKAPGYRLSPDHFQTVNRMLAPDWAQKMLCIIVPNRRTASPEFFSWVGTRLLFLGLRGCFSSKKKIDVDQSTKTIKQYFSGWRLFLIIYDVNFNSIYFRNIFATLGLF